MNEVLKKCAPMVIISLALLGGCASKNGESVSQEIDQGYNAVNTDVDDAMQDVEAAFEGGYNTNGPLSPGERDHVRQMAIYCNTSQANIRALRQKGLGWPAIAQKYGILNTPAYQQNCRYWR